MRLCRFGLVVLMILLFSIRSHKMDRFKVVGCELVPFCLLEGIPPSPRPSRPVSPPTQPMFWGFIFWSVASMPAHADQLRLEQVNGRSHLVQVPVLLRIRFRSS